MRFEVRALADGEIRSVVVEAIDQNDALKQVKEQSLTALSVRQAGGARSSGLAKFRVRFDLLLFSQEFLALIEAGLSIIEALDTLIERQGEGETRSVLIQIASRLREGRSLSAALETIPTQFPGLFVGIIRSSERTGNLQEALSRFISYRSRLDALRGKMISASIYPALLLVVGAVVTLFLAGYVVPRFAEVYHSAGRTLPWGSQLLMQWGGFVNRNLVWVLVSAIILGVLVFVMARARLRRGGLPYLLRRVPFIAERLHTYDLSRLYLTLGMLVDSGLPVVHAIALSSDSLLPAQQKAVREASDQIRKGSRFSSAFEQSGLTTPVGLRMMRIGEESGRLGEMLGRAARFHDDESARWMERFTRAAEPIMMIAIGMVVGTIVVLLYMPIFDLAGSIQ